MNTNFIECISLSKHFQGKYQNVIALEDVNIQITQGESVLIRGRSGAGKSTLLNLMCGLIKPSGGKVFFNGSCISDLQDGLLSNILLNEIGIIFQSFNLLPTYTIYENIEMALVPKGLNLSIINENITSLLEQFDLAGKANLLPSELSAGQQQKVAIIRTLVKNPSVIFADEPTGSVDDETAHEIIEHLINLKKEKKVTLVLASHGTIREIFPDRVYILENGRIKN
jgi:ABC-type lipoprotein export system ATPase subunit